LKTVVGFLSRPHGFAVLSSLVESNTHRLVRVYTHLLNPRSQDPSRSKRIDFDLFVDKCQKANIELITVDSKEECLIDFPDCDYIVEVSWRYLIPERITRKARIAAFGIHRGKLPDYAGAEPIKQAINKGEKEIILSSHHLGQIIDAGNVICTRSHPVNYNPQQSLDENIQRLRDEITPFFPELVFKTFEILERKQKPC
jgi:methionyl-tRNA formyltransferase